MTGDAKALWDDLKAELKNASDHRDPGRAERIDAAMAPVYALLKAFENERNHQPFVSQAPCPICGSGTVTYQYRAPLVGSMKCETPECIALNL